MVNFGWLRFGGKQVLWHGVYSMDLVSLVVMSLQSTAREEKLLSS
jgi:hypothetical protein